MAVGTYKLPICDGCKLPWLPVGWTQDSDPRNPEKPLRCGKCKSIGWDREFVKKQKIAVDVVQPMDLNVDPAAEEISDCLTLYMEATEMTMNPFDPTEMIEMPRNIALNKLMESHDLVFAPLNPEMCADVEAAQEANRLAEYVKLVPEPKKTRCKHRMTDCPICHPKEAA